MTLTLSTLAVALGSALALFHGIALARPKEFGVAARGFSRHVPVGIALMLLATAWFLWNFSQESISDFARFQKYMFAGFAAVGIGACFFVQDFLSIRAIAVLMLLVAQLMLETGRPMLSETRWTWVIQGWAYVLVLIGMWLTIAPWRMRDFIAWVTSEPKRQKLMSTVVAGWGVFIVVLGLTKFK